MNSKRILVALLLSSAGCTAIAQPVLQFAASSYTVWESAGSVTLSVQRTGDTNAAVAVDCATLDGTATNGLKYTAVSTNLAFGAGDTSKTVVVPILNEGFVEGTTTFKVILSNPTGGAVLDTRTNATVSITDNDVGIEFQFATYSVAEDAGAVVIGVVRGDDGILPATVGFATSDLTATNGLDYTGTNTPLSFAPSERLKWVTIPILREELKEGSRTFQVTLANPVGGSLGRQKTATVVIVDTDQGFQFEFGSYTVLEDAGAALVRVLRGSDDTNYFATVDYATSDGSATNGLDYLGSTNTLTFVPGDSAKLIAIPILNDGVKKPNRYFQVTLSNPTGGGTLGSPTTGTINVQDNDPGVGFEHTSYTTAWGQTNFSVNVLRGNDVALGPMTVDYATSDLTAKAGQDYQAVSSNITFQANETVKSLTIPILQNRPLSGAKSFRITLTNATGGAVLGTALATVSISGAYFTVAPPFDTALSIQNVGGLNMLTWTGGGQLQRADSPLGPWQTLSAARSPTTVQSPVPTTFYRVTRPRPVSLYVPSSYDGKTSVPLVILLHAYGDTGAGAESYVQIQPLAEAQGFLYCYPDSTVDRWGNQFWNATDAAGDFWNTGVDDAGYLRGLIQEIEGQLNVDRKRVHLVGHSNGAFMNYGAACQSADLIAGIASLAGTTFLNSTACAPSEPVNILHIHGTADPIIFYGGGAVTAVGLPATFPGNLPAYPGAVQTVQTWAAYNGATSPATDTAPSLDLTSDIAGLDTVVTRYTNSPPGGAVELWTINGGTHAPTLSPQFSPLVINWLLAHPKP